MEAVAAKESCFLTLTYDKEHLPESGSLVPEHLQKFLKRLRRELEPRRIRFFAVGEYGERTLRPHYHLALFGVDLGSHVGLDRMVKLKAWDLGNAHVGSLTVQSAQYIGGYVLKKLTNPDDPFVFKRLGGRHPEFARMSLRPGIGHVVVSGIARWLVSSRGNREVMLSGDVPMQLRMDGKFWSIGRYLRDQVRVAFAEGRELSIDVLKARSQLASMLRAMSEWEKEHMTDARRRKRVALGFRSKNILDTFSRERTSL